MESNTIELQLAGPRRTRFELVGVAAVEKAPLPGGLVPKTVRDGIAKLRRRSTFGRVGSWLETRTAAGSIVAAGVGAADDLTSRRVNRWVAEMVAYARSRGVRRLSLVAPEHRLLTTPSAIERILAAAAAAAYSFDSWRSDATPGSLDAVEFLLAARPSAPTRAAVTAANAVALGTTVCRNLANTPPNVATPVWMADQVRELAKQWGGKVTVLEPGHLARRGMGGILAVGGGSANPPRLVRWTTGEHGPRISLVGKGVTFDTGGISIKPAASMDEMKYDKCGACAVIGALVAARALGIEARIDLFVPLAENMPDAAAYRPGDIVRCYNGKTVEIVNTDAEGRMILADALAWAVESKPDHLLELSTLTGATVVALGLEGAALYSPDDSLADSLLAAGEDSAQRLWRMPLWEEFGDGMKGNHADLKNVGERWGSANMAAAFLAAFVGEQGSWAHLDIAGTAYSSKPVSAGQTGATGYGVALLVSWLRRLVQV